MAIDDTKEAAIHGLHAYKERLLVEIQQKQADLGSVERSIELLSGDTVVVTIIQNQAKKLLDTSESSVSRYSRLGKQAAVELFLRNNNGHWYKASAVAKELIRRGMTPISKHWAPAITGALNRAVAKGLAEKAKRNGVFMFRYKPETKQKE
jgi:hypothetical protein